MNKTIELKRVVVTGLGPISSVGIGLEDFWDALLKGKNGIKKITSMDATKFDTRIAGEITDFDPTKYMSKKEALNIDRFAQFAIAATKEAINDAGLNAPFSDESDSIGVIIGTGVGGLLTIEKQYEVFMTKGPGQISAKLIPKIIGNIPSAWTGILKNACGPNFGIVSACASGLHAIGEAFDKIRYGKALLMISGGTEAAITNLGIGGFANMKATTTIHNDEPENASRPFDIKRKGFVMSEGAGIVILEELEHAIKRNAKIYAEIIGYAANSDAYDIVHPSEDGSGARKCMQKAIDDAGIMPDEIVYINAHGTSTPINDRTETKAIKDVFGNHAYKIFVNSTKSMLGHALGAAGALEFIATALSVYHNKIHPTRNYDNFDSDCDLNYVPRMVETEVSMAMKNSFGFGGHNAVIIVKKYEKKNLYTLLQESEDDPEMAQLKEDIDKMHNVTVEALSQRLD